MKKKLAIQWIALACAVFLAAGIPLAHATEEWTLTESEQLAAEMIYQVYYLEDAEEQKLLLLQAVQTAPDSPFILLECADLLSILNTDGTLTNTIEQILINAKEMATGELLDHIVRTLGDHYLQAQGLDSARIYIEDELQKTPGDLTLLVMLAKVDYYGGQHENALWLLDEILAASPGALEAANLRAKLLGELGRFEESLEAYRLIEEQFPDNPEGLYGRYIPYIAAGQFEQAIRAVNEELLYSGDETLWLTRLEIRLSKLHDPEAALAEVEALLKAYPDWGDAYISKVNALIMLNRFDEAMEACRQTAAMSEILSQTLEGLTFLSFSRWEEAEKKILPALSNPYLQSVWADAATLYLEGYDDVDSATDAIIQSFAAEDNEFYSFMRLGDLNAHIGNYLEAARCYYYAEQYAQSDAMGMQMLVATLTEAGRQADALKYLEIMEARYPGWYETMIARIIYANMFDRADEALQAFVTLQEKYPYPASIMQPVEAVLLLIAGDAKGEKLMDDWMNQQDPEALTLSDWLQYAQAMQYTGNLEKLNDALLMAESYLEKVDPAHTNKIKQYQSELWSYRAEAARLSGDMEGCVEWLAKACEAGSTLLVSSLEMPDGTPFASEAYDALYEQYGVSDEPWDVTVLPVIPR